MSRILKKNDRCRKTGSKSVYASSANQAWMAAATAEERKALEEWERRYGASYAGLGQRAAR